jgi:hypothetical protein
LRFADVVLVLLGADEITGEVLGLGYELRTMIIDIVSQE